VEIWAGEQTEPVKDLYGVSFVMDLGSSKPDVQIVEATAGSLLGEDILFLPQIDRVKGVIAFGMTRKSGVGVCGSGILAKVKLKLLNPSKSVDLTIQDIYADDPGGNSIQLIASNSSTKLAGENVSLPTEYALYQNHPNPFNPTTTVRYDLPNDGEVTLWVYDGLGRVAATLVQGRESAGEHEVLFNASDLPSGLYYCRLQAGGVVLTRKMLLLK
jgi:hypothetical protein